MRTKRQHEQQRAFALPTVLIASIVLLTILAVSVTSTAAVRTALKTQYYVQLAQVAGESGVAMAKACLAQTGNIPTWTNAKPLTPASDCNGNIVLSPSVKALVVAGGGSGGGAAAGGGGAGGVIYNENVGIDEESFPVVVGAGGAAPGNQVHGKNGANSSFNGLVAIGGGGGGTASSDSTADSGGNAGGSGGGGQNYHTTAYASGAGTTGQGYAGGPLGTLAGSGGGGAGGPGYAGSGTNAGGNGGPGVQYNISGSMLYYAAGGGGAQNGSAGTGGTGDAAPGTQNVVASPGRPNSGDGGGAGWNYTGSNGGAGGSGVVIISFPTSSGIQADGGTVTISGANEIHKFTSSGTFTVNSQGSATCPDDDDCYVKPADPDNGDNVRSSFSVPKPTVDATGHALTIPNSGYTEIIRSSNHSVWRTYRQPSVQNAVVPDLCSGSATSAKGWNSAARATQQDSLASASSAQTISLSSGPVNAGSMYFRKDFNISKAGSYDFNLFTSSGQDATAAYLDGNLLTTSMGTLSTVSTTLLPGCHTFVISLFNQTILPRLSDFTASLTTTTSATPVVVTDTSWRVTAGDSFNFSTNNYNESNYYEPVTVAGAYSNTSLPWGGGPSDWVAASKDSNTNWITTTYSSGASFIRPAPAYAWFRSAQVTLAANANVLVSSYCDNSCDVYLDGNYLFSEDSTQNTVNKTVSIGAGTHIFGVRLFNAGSSANAAGFLFAAADMTNQASPTIISRSDASWRGTIQWSPTAGNPYSYDVTYGPPS